MLACWHTQTNDTRTLESSALYLLRRQAVEAVRGGSTGKAGFGRSRAGNWPGWGVPEREARARIRSSIVDELPD